jgi:catechol 2,3-dioxygenase-like lactoylglutathione lyase family enzyme
MWGGPPFSIPDNCCVEVRNLAAARKWYQEKLGLREAQDRTEDDSGRPFADLCISERGGMCISLVELEPGASPAKQHSILYARKLEKAHEWLAQRGVAVEPITFDSGRNRFFRFRDPEGNAIEICIEPG